MSKKATIQHEQLSLRQQKIRKFIDDGKWKKPFLSMSAIFISLVFVFLILSFVVIQFVVDYIEDASYTGYAVDIYEKPNAILWFFPFIINYGEKISIVKDGTTTEYWKIAFSGKLSTGGITLFSLCAVSFGFTITASWVVILSKSNRAILRQAMDICKTPEQQTATIVQQPQFVQQPQTVVQAPQYVVPPVQAPQYVQPPQPAQIIGYDRFGNPIYGR